jgi:hypothetical protein
MAGFTAYDVGHGALCITCHNSRRGLRNDSTFANFYGTTEASRAPHGPTQGDLLMGQNAFLVAVGIPGAHAAVSDSCVQCHMEETPPPDGLSYNQSGTNHTFYATTAICASCHGGDVDPAAIQGATEEDLEHLKALIEEGLHALLAEQTSQGNIIAFGNQVRITDAASIQAIEFTEASGQQAMAITLINGAHYGPLGMNSINVLGPNMNLLGRLYNFAAPELIKSGWNYFMIHNDGSLGVHNPAFVDDILGTSIDALEGAP